MTALLFSLLAAIAALAGGYLAISSRRQLNLTLGFTAGVILGLVSFDLLPEIFRTVNDTGLNAQWPMTALVIGFLTFHIVEKSILIHHEHEARYETHTHPHVGLASALALSGHSFLDGVAVGLAFQINNSVGIAVAIAVVAHRFADGFSTTNVMLYHQNAPKRAKQMLGVAATMPVLGALSTWLFHLPEKSLAVYLGFFAGFLLYIGASDILPQAHSKRPSRLAIVATVVGAAFMFVLAQLA